MEQSTCSSRPASGWVGVALFHRRFSCRPRKLFSGLGAEALRRPELCRRWFHHLGLFTFYDTMKLLVKLFLNKWQAKIKALIPARRIPLPCYPGGVCSIEPVLSSVESKQAISTNFTAVSMVCVTGFLPSRYFIGNGLAIDRYVLIQIGGQDLDLYHLFMEGRQKPTRTDRPSA